MQDYTDLSNFVLLQKSGEGDDGVVWKAKRKSDDQICAIKILRYSLIYKLKIRTVPLTLTPGLHSNK